MAGIPKLQMVSDPVAVRHMLTAIEEGSVLGLFPRMGQVSYSGRDLRMPPGSGRLLKQMNVPVRAPENSGFLPFDAPNGRHTNARGRITAEAGMLADARNRWKP